MYNGKNASDEAAAGRKIIKLQIRHSVTSYTDFTEAFITFKSHTDSRNTSKYNIIYAHKKRAAFPASIFTKLASSQQRYVQIPYTKSHANRTVNVRNAKSHSFVALSKKKKKKKKTFNAAIFVKLIIIQ
jgi:hypothetical protein